jgi:hypothetical protein
LIGGHREATAEQVPLVALRQRDKRRPRFKVRLDNTGYHDTAVRLGFRSPCGREQKVQQNPRRTMYHFYFKKQKNKK